MMKLKKFFIKTFKLFLSLILYVAYINGFYFFMSKIDGISREQLANILNCINTIDNCIFIFGLILTMNFFVWIHRKINEKKKELIEKENK